MSDFVIAGGGLAGSLLALYLAKSGHGVRIYERRGDLRKEPASGGRSINLALSARGIHALHEVGMASRILQSATPMKGRMIHARNRSLLFQPYGTKETDLLYSVSRQALNGLLLEEAERHEEVKIFFHHKVTGLDLTRRFLFFEEESSRKVSKVEALTIIGADGVHSALRSELEKQGILTAKEEILEWGYKELLIPAGPLKTFLLLPHALHIWPRHDFMLIALANQDCSFTCTLFLPFQGEKSFEKLSSSEAVQAFFELEFPDAASLMPDLAHDFFHNPTSSLPYLHCLPWHYEDKIALIGDACHAVVPFYGQGMNAAFEDCHILSRCIKKFSPNLKNAYEAYEKERKPDTDALASLSLQNFIEMRHKVASRFFLWQKGLEKLLHKFFPSYFTPLYSMVTFSRIPYLEAVRRDQHQKRLLVWLFAGAALGILALVALWAKLL